MSVYDIATLLTYLIASRIPPGHAEVSVSGPRPRGKHDFGDGVPVANAVTTSIQPFVPSALAASAFVQNSRQERRREEKRREG